MAFASRSLLHQFGRYFDAVPLGSALVLASNDPGAGGPGAPVVHSSSFLDRVGYLSGKAALLVSATLAEGETATVKAASVLDAAATDGAGAEQFEGSDQSLVLTGGVGGTTETGVIEINLDLAGASVAMGLEWSVEMSRAAAGDQLVIFPVFLGAKRRIS